MTTSVAVRTDSLRQLMVMADYYFRKFAERFAFPADYLTVDLETNGFSPVQNQICTYGYSHVRNHQLVSTHEFALAWMDHPDIDERDFRSALDSTQRSMTEKGKAFHHTYDFIRRNGIDPIRALEHLLAVVEHAEENNIVVVAHNGWRFDVEFMQAHFHNWLQVPYEFPDECLYDSGILEKASQLLELGDDAYPRPGESMREFARRIGAIRARGVYWSLDGHCEDRYDLTAKVRRYGLAGEDHQAGFDSQKLHFLIQEHRLLAEAAVNELEADERIP